ncbi:MAG: hypothetical protein QOF28_158, partial [Actinomycetota bacterium]|nr:hypothetical protein [Actinomycetota bacterium]
IQTWLGAQASYLRETRGISIVQVVEADDAAQAGTWRFEVVDAGPSVNAVLFLLPYYARSQQSAPVNELTALVDGFVEALDRAATDLGTVLMTAEGFASFFIAGDERLLHGLDRLAQRHTLRIAYYVRPQHTALEARWRQWGFRSEMSPSAWVRDQADSLRYADTLDQVRRLAPNLSFDVRPFRPDLLVGRDVVVDFARGFLGIEDPPAATAIDDNVGLPLDLANLLRGAPAALLDDPGSRINTGARQLALGVLGHSWTVEESRAARESRHVLHRYAYREFEPRNRDLAAQLAWPTESFVPPPEPADPELEADVEALDDLWRPRASPTARAYLYAALSQLVTRRPRP